MKIMSVWKSYQWRWVIFYFAIAISVFFAVLKSILVIVGAIVYFVCESKPKEPELPDDDDLPTPSKWAGNEEIRIFRQYLRIPTVHPNVDYRPAVTFLEKQAKSLNLPVSIYYPVNKENPVVVMTWEGERPELPSIMLNSHMDVVAVFEEYWTHLPFAAEMEENGDIYARGAQDTKCIGMQYLAAIRSLKRQGISRMKRTHYIVFVPDEEVGGKRGMLGFSKTDTFKAMNIAFALDECSNGGQEDGSLGVYYVERTIWQIEFEVHGQSGHGSKLLDNTPGEKLNYVLDKMTKYRAEEKRKHVDLKYAMGNVTSINLTKIRGGVANNVIPAEMSATFDIRLSYNADIDEFEQQLNRWCEEAGGNITIKTLDRGPKQTATKVDDSNSFWVAFKKGAEEAGLRITPIISVGATDMRFIRNEKISAIGFSPLVNTTSRAHDHNEYLNADTFLMGIEVYKKIILNLDKI